MQLLRRIRLYTSSIEPTIARHMVPVRLDRLPRSEAIYTSFADAIGSSLAVIADITLLNENVMYEVGYAHGRGLTPLIYTRDVDRLEHLPVYFRTLNVRLVSEATPVLDQAVADPTTTAALVSAVALYLNRRLRSPGNPRFKYSKLLHLNRRLCHGSNKRSIA